MNENEIIWSGKDIDHRGRPSAKVEDISKLLANLDEFPGSLEDYERMKGRKYEFMTRTSIPSRFGIEEGDDYPLRKFLDSINKTTDYFYKTELHVLLDEKLKGLRISKGLLDCLNNGCTGLIYVIKDRREETDMREDKKNEIIITYGIPVKSKKPGKFKIFKKYINNELFNLRLYLWKKQMKYEDIQKEGIEPIKKGYISTKTLIENTRHLKEKKGNDFIPQYSEAFLIALDNVRRDTATAWGSNFYCFLHHRKNYLLENIEKKSKEYQAKFVPKAKGNLEDMMRTLVGVGKLLELTGGPELKIMRSN